MAQIIKNNRDYICGLDVGTNSVGWGVLACNIEQGKDGVTRYHPTELLDCNSRIFEEAVTLKTRVPKNQTRRAKRGMRRMQGRYRRRRDHLVHTLQRENFLIATDARTLNAIDKKFAHRMQESDGAYGALNENILANPFAMRAIGLDRALEPHEFGRVLLHFIKHRGYFSNRGAKYIALNKYIGKSIHETPEDNPDTNTDSESTETKEQINEAKTVLTGIKETEDRRKAGGHRTVGEYIFRTAAETRKRPKRINTHTFSLTSEKKEGTAEKPKKSTKEYTLAASRELYETEFDLLWKAQEEQGAFGSRTAQDIQRLKKKIKDIIYMQRPLKIQKGLVGACSFEPQKKRAPKAAIEYQEARIWQYINNIKCDYKYTTTKKKEKEKGNKGVLSSEQRYQLYEAACAGTGANKSGRIPWGAVAKILNIPKEALNYKDTVYEDGTPVENSSGIIINRTRHAIQSIVNTTQIDEEKLLADLLTIHDKKALYRRLVKYWKFAGGENNTAHQLATLELEAGYSKHCYKVWKNLLLHLQKGDLYSKAVENAKYKQESKKEVDVPDNISDIHIPNIANPVVQRALSEAAKIVNAIISKHGRPAIIRIELARDMKASKKHRADIMQQQKIDRAANVNAEQKIAECLHADNRADSQVPRTLVMRYRLWEEQSKKCVYCDGCIPIAALLSGQCDVDHIIPRSIYAQNKDNTVIACRTCNADKRERTPYQAWHGTDKWAQIKYRLQNNKKDKHYKYISARKREKILSEKPYEADEDGFVERQLNDTRYIAVAVKNVLEQLGVPVQISTGSATSIMNKEWGLYRHLLRHPDDTSIETYLFDDVGGEVSTTSTKKWQWQKEDDAHLLPTTAGISYALKHKDEQEVVAFVLRENEETAIGIKKWHRADFEALPAAQRTMKYIVKNAVNFEEAEQKKNRRDHRHHALDAIMVSLVDQKLYRRLLRIWREPSTLSKDERTPLKFSEVFPHFKGGRIMLHERIKHIFEQRIVSHQLRTKIAGALHEETVYGRGVYYDYEALSVNGTCLKRIQQYTIPAYAPDTTGDINADGKVAWIPDREYYRILKEWATTMKPLPTKERTLPKDSRGHELSRIKVAHRCYVVRKPMDKIIEIINKVKLPTKQMDIQHRERTGKGGWIHDDATYYAIARWKQHNPGAKYKELLQSSPPRTVLKDGTEGNIIKRVRIASIKDKDSIVQIRPAQFVEYGSNHHVTIFEEVVQSNTTAKNKPPQRKGDFVTTYQALQRAHRGQLVFQKEAPAEWEGSWKYIMHLSINDIVEILPDGKIDAELEQFPTRYYRVQGMSGPDKRITFRYHALSGASKTHGEIRKSLNKLRFKKIAVDTLGNIADTPQ